MSLYCDHCGAEVDATVRFEEDDDRGIWLRCTNTDCDRSGRFGGNGIRVVDRGRGVATDGGVEITDATIHHYECQGCGAELDWVEIDTCPSCGSDELKEIHVIADGGEVSESFDRGCPLCGQIGKPTMSIGDESELEQMEYSRYQCNNADCKIDEYRLGRRPVTDGGQEVSRLARQQAPRLTGWAMKFDSDHIPSIEAGEKTVTVRLRDEWPDIEAGGNLDIFDDEGRFVAHAIVEETEDFPVASASLAINGVEGHRDYEYANDFLDDFRGYYPNREIDMDTMVRVIHFSLTGSPSVDDYADVADVLEGPVTDGGEEVGSGNQHHLYTDDPECTWCRGEFEDRQTVVTIQWEFPSSTRTVLFCTHECATEWDCGNSRKSRGEVICHV